MALMGNQKRHRASLGTPFGHRSTLAVYAFTSPLSLLLDATLPAPSSDRNSFSIFTDDWPPPSAPNFPVAWLFDYPAPNASRETSPAGTPTRIKPPIPATDPSFRFPRINFSRACWLQPPSSDPVGGRRLEQNHREKKGGCLIDLICKYRLNSFSGSSCRSYFPSPENDYGEESLAARRGFRCLLIIFWKGDNEGRKGRGRQKQKMAARLGE